MCTRRVWISITKNTRKRLRNTVSTCRRSHDRNPRCLGGQEQWTSLSPQELQIAQLAAEGLSNRDIGQRLYLSHRTVGSHLYRIFPKLGISSRVPAPVRPYARRRIAGSRMVAAAELPEFQSDDASAGRGPHASLDQDLSVTARGQEEAS
jgi:DNA-binding CsgD family transcriptional regulator